MRDSNYRKRRERRIREIEVLFLKFLFLQNIIFFANLIFMDFLNGEINNFFFFLMKLTVQLTKSNRMTKLNIFET